MQQKWNTVHKSKSGRDYATYHYALQSSWDGDNPYNTDNLNRRSRAEKTRKSVHPFFYPPPSLLSMVWAKPMSLSVGYQCFFWLNQLLIVGTFLVLYRWLRLSPLILGLLAITFTPLADTVKMGQANAFILFMLSIALSRSSGIALGIAAMTKMSPALIFFQWLIQRRWIAVFRCCLAAILLSLFALPLISLEHQAYFYLEVLPGFSSGQYHGLNIPINIPANHSVPDLFNQIWPNSDQQTLSVTAKQFSFVTNLALLLSVLFLSFKWNSKQARPYLDAAMICLLLIFPVYCYEHHLALMVLPFVLIFHGLRQYKASIVIYGVAGTAYFFAAWPLFALRFVQKNTPSIHWLLQESKFFAIIVTGLLCLWCAYKANQRADNACANFS